MSRRSLAQQTSGTFPQRSESSHGPASVIYRELGNSWALRRLGSLRWKVTFMREEAEERAAKGERWRLDGLTEHRGSTALDCIGPKAMRSIIESLNWASVAQEVLATGQTFIWTAWLVLILMFELLVFPFHHTTFSHLTSCFQFIQNHKDTLLALPCCPLFKRSAALLICQREWWSPHPPHICDLLEGQLGPDLGWEERAGRWF